MLAYYPQKIFVVLDNARFQKEPGVLSLCQRHPQKIELWFLPPYSSDLNAAEPIWGYTRRGPLTTDFSSIRRS
jgi:transposase